MDFPASTPVVMSLNAFVKTVGGSTVVWFTAVVLLDGDKTLVANEDTILVRKCTVAALVPTRYPDDAMFAKYSITFEQAVMPSAETTSYGENA